MRTLSRKFVIGVVGFEIIIVFFMLNHLGGIAWQFSQLLGAIVGGTIALVSVNIPVREGDAIEPMLGRERLAWTLVGCGLISWGIGESFWRYYILTNQSPFPSESLSPRSQSGTMPLQSLQQSQSSRQNQPGGTQASWPGQLTWPKTAPETEQRTISGGLAAQDALRNGSKQE